MHEPVSAVSDTGSDADSDTESEAESLLGILDGLCGAMGGEEALEDFGVDSTAEVWHVVH